MVKLKIGVIGVGYWGQNFIRIIENNKELFTLVALVDQKKQNLLTYKEKAKTFSNVDDLIKSEIEIDCCIVATSTITHFEITNKLLNAGINCLVEKPITANLKEAQKLFGIANKKNLTLMVDHTFLYDNGILELKKYIDSGTLGKILHISFERTNLGPIRSDVNAAWDLSAHDLSIILSIIKKDPINIYVAAKAFLNNEIEDMFNISLDFGDIFVTIFTSWYHPVKSRVIKVVGDQKMAVWNGLDPNNELIIYDKGVTKNIAKYDYGSNRYTLKFGDVLIPAFEKSEPLKNVIVDFYNRINKLKNNELNDTNLTLRLIKLLEEINKKVK